MNAEWRNVWQMNAKWSNVWQMHNAEWTNVSEHISQIFNQRTNAFQIWFWAPWDIQVQKRKTSWGAYSWKYQRQKVLVPVAHEKTGIVRPFELGETRLIRSTVTKCRPSKFLMIQSHERNIKPFRAASGFLGWLCPIKVTFRGVFQSPESQFKNCYQFQLTTIKPELLASGRLL